MIFRDYYSSIKVPLTEQDWFFIISLFKIVRLKDGNELDNGGDEHGGGGGGDDHHPNLVPDPPTYGIEQ